MRPNLKAASYSLALLFSVAATGCGVASQRCGTSVVDSVGPAAATADHLSAAPANQAQFTATATPGATPEGSECAVPAIIVRLTPTWSVSDNINVKISSAQDATNGLATCVGATTGPVTVTATQVTAGTGVSQIVGTAALTCK